MHDFEKLDVWRKAHDLTLSVYKATESLPREETFGLALQLRRGVTSIPLRIAEACGRDARPEFDQAVRQARGAGVELEYLLLLARDLGLFQPGTHDDLQDRLIEVRRMLSGLIRAAL